MNAPAFRGMDCLRVLLLTLIFWDVCQVKAKQLLADLNLDSGTWELVCISVYNHNPSKLQQRLGTFVIQNKRVLKDIQQTWDFAGMYDDHCDYHFVIKLYRDKELMKTFRVNVVCNYISEGVFSYEFNPDLLLVHETYHQKLPWSLVRYKTLQGLRNALPFLEEAHQVYIYQDIKPYLHDGYFILATEDLPWNVDRDSILKSIQNQLRSKLTHDRFYVVPYIFFMNEKEQISLRFIVYCSEADAKKWGGRQVQANWRSHQDNRDLGDLFELVVIGVDDQNYYKIVYGR